MKEFKNKKEKAQLDNDLSEKQEKQLYNFIEEELERMTGEGLLEFAREKLIDFYFDWEKEELLALGAIKKD